MLPLLLADAILQERQTNTGFNFKTRLNFSLILDFKASTQESSLNVNRK